MTRRTHTTTYRDNFHLFHHYATDSREYLDTRIFNLIYPENRHPAYQD